MIGLSCALRKGDCRRGIESWLTDVTSKKKNKTSRYVRVWALLIGPKCIQRAHIVATEAVRASVHGRLISRDVKSGLDVKKKGLGSL
jgi:hypothetical protein